MHLSRNDLRQINCRFHVGAYRIRIAMRNVAARWPPSTATHHLILTESARYPPLSVPIVDLSFKPRGCSQDGPHPEPVSSPLEKISNGGKLLVVWVTFV
jgi:hypothetical protein